MVDSVRIIDSNEQFGGLRSSIGQVGKVGAALMYAQFTFKFLFILVRDIDKYTIFVNVNAIYHSHRRYYLGAYSSPDNHSEARSLRVFTP